MRIINYALYEIIKILPQLSSTGLYVLLSYYILEKPIKEITEELGYSSRSGWVYKIREEALEKIKEQINKKEIIND